MKKINLFLASSNELKAERDFINQKINAKNKVWSEKNIFFQLEIWEDESEMMSSTRSQDEYNKLVRQADLFICMAFTKVGKYTHEEFEQAYHQFKETGQPNIIVYFKQADYPSNVSWKDLKSLDDFKAKLKTLDYFPSSFETKEGVWSKINEELDRYTRHLSFTNESDIPKFLTKPPFLPDYFIGRDEDLEAIHQKLFGANNLLLLVNGRGGMGKTTIAAKYFQTYQADYQHLAWVFTGESMLEALLTLAIPLNVQFGDKMPNEQRLTLLLQKMANLKKPCLLVIDNANDLDDLTQHYNALRRCHNFHLLLTSRITEFQSAKRHEVQPLKWEDRLLLFQHHYPKLQASEYELLRSIITAVGKNTLVIELLAKNLREFNRFKTSYSLQDLLNDLQEKGLLAIKGKPLQVSYQSGDQLRTATPEDIIAAMYDLNQLTEAERQLLSIFAVLPAENIAFATLEDLLPDLADLTSPLQSLLQNGWLEYNEATNSFKVSPVVQEITIKKNENILAHCTPLIDRLSHKLNYEGVTGHLLNSTFAAAVTWVRYASFLVEQLDKKPSINLSILIHKIGSYFSTTGDLVNALKYFNEKRAIEKSLLATSPNKKDYKNGLAISYSKLGDIHTRLGDLDKALTFFDQYNQLEKELHEAYPENVSFKNELAISYQWLGITHTSLGFLEKALLFFEQLNQLFEELYASSPENVSSKKKLAISYQFLGNTHASLGNLEKALFFFEQLNQLFEALYASSPENVSFKKGLAISYEKLGETYASLGNLEKTLIFFEQFNQLEKELHKAYPENVSFKNGLAISYEKLGDTHTSLGNLDKALSFFEQSNQLEKELHESYPENVSFKNNLAISYSKLALHYQTIKDDQQARQYATKAQGHWQALVKRFPAYVEFKNNLDWVNEKF